MGRPNQTGNDYFSFDVNFFEDTKIQRLTANYGHQGIVLFLKLLCKLYKDNGYFMHLDNDEAKLFTTFEVRMNVKRFWSIIHDMLKWGLFDKEKYDRYSILTSRSIQHRFFTACRRRRQVKGEKSFILIDINEYNLSKSILAALTQDNAEKMLDAKMQEKGNREKETGKERMETPPTKSQVKDYFLGLGMKIIEAETYTEKFFNHYESRGWPEITDWKRAADKAACEWDIPTGEHRKVENGKLIKHKVAK